MALSNLPLPEQSLPDCARWQASEPYSIVVEEEVMLLHPSDWTLAQETEEVFETLPAWLASHAGAETHAAVIELTTDPHDDLAEAERELSALRAELRDVLERPGYRAAVAGTHPRAECSETQVSSGARYQLGYESMRELARREPTFALHVHVGVADESALRLYNCLRAHAPLLLALSANSPFWQGRDAGLASTQTPIFQMFPRVGIPRAFGSYADYVETIDVMLRSEAFPEPTFLWWDVRLQPRFGTVELRVMDAQSTVARVAALASFVQCIAHLDLEQGFHTETLIRAPEILAENRFLAARDGMRARLIDPDRECRVLASAQLADLILAARPHAQQLGSEAMLDVVAEMAEDSARIANGGSPRSAASGPSPTILRRRSWLDGEGPSHPRTDSAGTGQADGSRAPRPPASRRCSQTAPTNRWDDRRMLVRASADDRRPVATPAEVARLLVGALGLVGFWLNGIGPALPQLQHDLHVNRGTVAFYPSAFAVGLIVLGATAPRLTAPGRRHVVFVLAVLGLGSGAALLAAAIGPVLSLVGALIMGFSAALLIALVPALVSDVRGTRSADLLSRANAFSSAAGLAAPLLVAGALALGIGWATGFLVVPLAGAVVVLFLLRQVQLPDAEPPPAPPPERPSAGDLGVGGHGTEELRGAEAEPWRSWLSLVLAVSIEFCLVFWAPSYMHSHLGLRTATAAALAGAFLLGMAVGRASVTPITRVTGSDEKTIVVITGVVVSGFVVFWFAHAPWLATVGLLVLGLGVALMYPLTAARYVETAPAGSTRASARAALGSGVAIGVAPFVLATISDATGLHAAYLLVPALCAALVVNTWLLHRSTAGSRRSAAARRARGFTRQA